MTIRESLERWEEIHLSKYATLSKNSKGRQREEEQCDIRPVFQRVAELQASGAFTSLRGLIYFTDGMGTYPQKRPPYDAAFVLLEEPPMMFKSPPWAIRLVLDALSLERTAKELDLSLDSDLEELPQL